MERWSRLQGESVVLTINTCNFPNYIVIAIVALHYTIDKNRIGNTFFTLHSALYRNPDRSQILSMLGTSHPSNGEYKWSERSREQRTASIATANKMIILIVR